MDALYEFLLNYGYIGMMIAAFMAGTVFPFNSELIMLGLAATGLDPWKLIIWGTIGNTAGGMTNYAIGLLGKTEWFVKFFHINEERLDKVQGFVKKYGPWMATVSFLPAFGSVICIALGMLRANPWLTLLAMILGKGIRYILFAFAPELF